MSILRRYKDAARAMSPGGVWTSSCRGMLAERNETCCALTHMSLAFDTQESLHNSKCYALNQLGMIPKYVIHTFVAGAADRPRHVRGSMLLS